MSIEALDAVSPAYSEASGQEDPSFLPGIELLEFAARRGQFRRWLGELEVAPVAPELIFGYTECTAEHRQVVAGMESAKTRLLGMLGVTDDTGQDNSVAHMAWREQEHALPGSDTRVALAVQIGVSKGRFDPSRVPSITAFVIHRDEEEEDVGETLRFRGLRLGDVLYDGDKIKTYIPVQNLTVTRFNTIATSVIDQLTQEATRDAVTPFTEGFAATRTLFQKTAAEQAEDPKPTYFGYRIDGSNNAAMELLLHTSDTGEGNVDIILQGSTRTAAMQLTLILHRAVPEMFKELQSLQAVARFNWLATNLPAIRRAIEIQVNNHVSANFVSLCRAAIAKEAAKVTALQRLTSELAANSTPIDSAYAPDVVV